jgi:hypothetical protein
MSVTTIVVIMVATVGLAALELCVFWRLGERPGERTERRPSSRRLTPSRLVRRARQKRVRERLHRRSLWRLRAENGEEDDVEHLEAPRHAVDHCERRQYDRHRSAQAGPRQQNPLGSISATIASHR